MTSPSPFLTYLLDLPPDALPSIYSDGLPPNPLVDDQLTYLPRGNFAVRTLFEILCSAVEKPILLRMCAPHLTDEAGRPHGVSFVDFKTWFALPNAESQDESSFLASISSHFNVLKLLELHIIDCPSFLGSASSAPMDVSDGASATAPRPSAPQHSSPYFIRLTPPFHRQLKLSLRLMQVSPWTSASSLLVAGAAPRHNNDTTTAPTPPDRVTPPPCINITADDLEMYTQKRWSSVLHYLVDPSLSSGVGAPTDAMIKFVRKVGLMSEVSSQDDNDGWSSSSASSSRLCITSAGYEFMLQDVHLQVWQFVLQYLIQLQEDDNCALLTHEALLFIFSLTHCVVGTAYGKSSLDKKGVQLMKDFSEFGLIYYDKNADPDVFYPTRVAVNLVRGATSASHAPSSAAAGADSLSFVRPTAVTRALESALAAPDPSNSPHLAIIVQTNFQVVAYTTSNLHVKMLDFFCCKESMTRLPNLVVTKLTRRSVKGAFDIGITVEQILRFLKMNSHPRLTEGGGAGSLLVPANVEDQLMLWDREGRRLQVDECYEVQCRDDEQFVAVCKYAKDIHGDLWASVEQRLVYVRFEKAVKIVQYKQRWDARRETVRLSSK